MADNNQLISVGRQRLLDSNPEALQRDVIEAVERSFQYRIVDATNPFVQQLETAVALACGAINGYEGIERRIYPANAQTYEDIYMHMSDEDFLRTFSTPGKSKIDLYLRRDELFNYGANFGNDGGKRLVIPRDTTIRVDGFDMAIHNQVNIDITRNRGLRITYDMSDVSPLAPLPSNEVRWDVIRDTQHEYVRIRLPVEQLTHSTASQAVSNSTGFDQHFPFNDQFYYCTVFHRVNNRWVRMRTTHTEQVYDISDPTAVLRVYESTVRVVIPTVYFSSGVIGNQIRVDVYSSQGFVESSIQELPEDMISARFVDYGVSNDPYITAFNNLPTRFMMAVEPLGGGADRMSFEELRRLVIADADGQQSIPITPAQLDRVGEYNGYALVKHVDDVTQRDYLATRKSPTSVNEFDGYSPLPVTMMPLIASFEDLITHGDVNLGPTGDRLTILPKALFKLINGKLSIVGSPEKNMLQNMPADTLVTTLNSGSYLYTPFYYVLDTGEARFRTRVYDFDSPTIPLKNFIEINESSGVEISAVNHSIEKTPTGFRLLLQTESNDLFKDIVDNDPTRFNCQLSMIPNDGGVRMYQSTGVMVDVNDVPIKDEFGEYFIEFIIDTQYDVDETNGLQVSGFGSVATNMYDVPVALSQLFDIVYIVDDVQQPGQYTTDIDLLINDTFLDPGAVVHVGVAHDQITLQTGTHLNHLWTRSATSLRPEQYQTYATDIPAYYTKDVFRYNASGHIDTVWDTVTGKFVQKREHWIHDPILTNTYTVHTMMSQAIGVSTLTFSGPGIFTQADVGKYFVCVSGLDDGTGRLVGQITSVIDGNTIETDAVTTAPIVAGDVFVYGDITYKHRAGDVIQGPDGPIPVVTDRQLDRATDVLLFDGMYYFATSETTLEYRKQVRDTIVQWTTEDIARIQEQLLEQTSIYYYPQRMIGAIDVWTIDGGETILEAKQNLTVRVFVNSEAFYNESLMVSIENMIARTINDEIQNKTIDIAGITDKVRAVVGDSVITIKIDGLLSGREYVVTVKDNAARFSLGKQAVVLSDGSVAVKDSIVFQRYIHNRE